MHIILLGLFYFCKAAIANENGYFLDALVAHGISELAGVVAIFAFSSRH